MSLVDYSSDDDDEEQADLRESLDKMDGVVSLTSMDMDFSTHLNRNNALDTTQLQQLDAVVSVPSSSGISQTSLLLPDASELLDAFQLGLNNVTMMDQASRVTAAAVASTSRKRPDLNGASHPLPRTKIPKGSLPPSRILPDTAGGVLIPPQVRGRSNVATEDLERLFSKREKS